MQRVVLVEREDRVADLLDRIRVQIDARLGELRPLVDEHRRLDSALQALGVPKGESPGPQPASSSAQTRSRARKTKPAKPRQRAPRGANRDAVMRAVQDRPGVSSAELAAVSGVGQNTLYGLLARLVKNGELQARALPTGRMGYTLGDTRPALSAAIAPADGEIADQTSAAPADSAAS
jgi:hypothetical protein